MRSYPASGELNRTTIGGAPRSAGASMHDIWHLRNIDWLRELSPGELGDLQRNASHKRYAGGEMVFHVDAAHRAKHYRDAVNTPQLRTDDYTLVNGRISYRSAEGTWEAAAFITNITDEIYITNGVSVLGLEYIEAYYSRPREWGFSLTYNF